MPLLNYTTTVAAEKTVAEVQRMLAKAGARQIMTDYNGSGAATGVTFSIDDGDGVRAFTLPVRTDRVHAVMSRYESGIPNRYQSKEQAERVAWRIAKDWLEAQLAIVETEMVTFTQVMLPYMRAASGSTLYELYIGGELLPALGAGT